MKSIHAKLEIQVIPTCLSPLPLIWGFANCVKQVLEPALREIVTNIRKEVKPGVRCEVSITVEATDEFVIISVSNSHRGGSSERAGTGKGLEQIGAQLALFRSPKLEDGDFLVGHLKKEESADSFTLKICLPVCQPMPQ